MFEINPQYGPRDELVAEQMAEGEDRRLLLAAFAAAQDPIGRHVPLAVLLESYATAGYWYALSKDNRRNAPKDSKVNAQFHEEYLEALVKTLDKALMGAMHVGKMERYAGA